MRQAVMGLCAVGCVAAALLFGKTSETDWGSLILSALFAGLAGFLQAVAA